MHFVFSPQEHTTSPQQKKHQKNNDLANGNGDDGDSFIAYLEVLCWSSSSMEIEDTAKVDG